MIIKHPYGSVEYYEDCFSDIVGDLGDTNPDDPSGFKMTANMMKGMEKAIKSCLQYHSNAAEKYQHLLHVFQNYRDSPYNNFQDQG